MMNNRLITTNRLLVYLIAFSLICTSCSDDGVDTPSEPAPEIPPITTFEMDFESFPEDPGGRQILDPKAGTRWAQARIGIAVWNTLIGVATIVPVAAFKASIAQSPEFIGDNTWQWTFDFDVAGIAHQAKLQGTLVSDGVDWSMLLSKEGEFIDYKWYTGHANATRTEGSWTLNFGPEQDKPFLQIDWSRNTDNTVAEVRYTSIDPDNVGIGSYIHFGINEETPYNAFYDIFDKTNDNLVEIEWNRETNEGRIKNPRFFEDENYHCWDSDLENVDC